MAALERLLTGADVACNTMEAYMVTSDVVSSNDNDQEDGFDEEGLEAAAAGL